MNSFVLNFHGIGTPGPDIPIEERRYWLAEKDFKNVLDQVAGLRCDHEIEITFDDGNESDLRIALPALAERMLEATFFICSGRIGQNGYVDKEAIRELLKSGMRIGSHGVDHVDWRRCSTTQLRKETLRSRQVLEEVSGEAVVAAGIPFGSYDRRVVTSIAHAGYTTAYTSDGGFAPRGAFLRARNTLEASAQGHNIECLITRSKRPLRRLKRSLTRLVKQKR